MPLPFALELNLSEETGDLGGVDGASLGARVHHQLQVVLRERLDQTWKESVTCE